jgi:uncharacterized protein (TIGR00304 family)
MPETLLTMPGIILIMLGLFSIVFWMISRSIRENPGEKTKENIKSGGVVMIGPVPVIFGSDKKSALIVILLAIVLMILAIILIKLE